MRWKISVFSASTTCRRTVVEETLGAFASEHVLRIALGIDVRVRGFLDDATSVLERIPVANERDLSVLFLDASDEALLAAFLEHAPAASALDHARARR